MQRDEFETLVQEVIEQLPESFKTKLDNVEVVVETIPSWRQLARLGLSHPLSLFGLYEGVPQTQRGITNWQMMPDKITIFQAPIEYFYRTPEAIKTKVQAVVKHEIGHHFGLSEADLAHKPKAQ